MLKGNPFAFADQAARGDINLYCESVLKDQRGDLIRQGEIHVLIQAHIDWCWERGLGAGIVAPWGHGKTEQVVIARASKEIGDNQDIRLKIVCNTDGNAAKRVASLRRYIESDPDYNRIYPSVKPKRVPGRGMEKWSDHELLVDRRSPGKDSTVEAWGIFAGGVGTRCDLLIIDDPADLKNSVQEPASRAKVGEAIRSTWIPRLEPDGRIIYIATVWHEADATAEMMTQPGFAFLWIAVSEDYSCLEAKAINADASHPLFRWYNGGRVAESGKMVQMPLWEDVWDKKALIDRRKKIGEREFDRGYRQIPYSTEDTLFKHFQNCIIRQNPFAPDDWFRYMGVDLSGDSREGTAIFVLAHSPEGVFYPLEVQYGAWGSVDIAQRIFEMFLRHRPRIILVENNALQDMLVTWLREASYKLPGSEQMLSIPVRGFHTGKQKFDPFIGLPSLDIDFENRRWVIPHPPGHSFDCQCGMCRWIRSMKLFPLSAETDTVMASWFAREAALQDVFVGAAPVTVGERPTMPKY